MIDHAVAIAAHERKLAEYAEAEHDQWTPGSINYHTDCIRHLKALIAEQEKATACPQ